MQYWMQRDLIHMDNDTPCVIVDIEVQLIWSLKVMPSFLSVLLTCTRKQFSVEENPSTSWVDK